MTESIWADAVRSEGIDRDHDDAIRADEFFGLTRSFAPILDDEASAARIQEVESTRRIVWGDTCRPPLTGAEVLRAFALIDAGIEPGSDLDFVTEVS